MKKIGIGLAIIVPVLGSAIETPEKLPNVVFVLVDDLGIGDLSLYGQRLFSTPNIDALADQGLVYTQHYAGCTVSAPSRGSLMTGKHMGNSYVRGNMNTPNVDGHTYDLPLIDSEITIAEVLRLAGYQTACIGKWGLGGPNTEGHPNQQGFDYFYGYLGQLNAHRHFPEFLHENGTLVELGGREYAQELIMQKAFGYISDRAKANQPFFLYLTPVIPHADLQALDEDLEKYAGKYPEVPYKGGHYRAENAPRATYAGMIHRLDQDMGRLVQHLKAEGLWENTIVVFTSDNGPHTEGGHDPYFFDSNGPFRGTKRDLYDGGIRTPLIISWPDKIKERRVTDHISAFWDFLPTFAELARVECPIETDGISMLPTILGNKATQKQHTYLYWEFHELGGRQAVRVGNWKLIRLNAKNPDESTLELYNLRSDPGEQFNLSTQYPDTRDFLLKFLDSARTPSDVFRW